MGTTRTPITAGRCLYIGGSDMFNRMNQPAQHLPVHWAQYVEQLDVVGFRPFYDGPPVSALKRLSSGLKSLLTQRVEITQSGNVRRIDVRQLRLPGLLDVLVQEFWLLLNLRRHLQTPYDIAIVYAPETAFIARYLKRKGRVGRLLYHDIDYYPYVPSIRPSQKRIVAWREALAVRTVDAVISVSRPLVELRKQQGARDVLYLPNGVDFDYFTQANAQRATQPDPHPPTLLYIGTLDHKWGVDLPIRAMPLIRQHLPAARLLIAGKGRAEDDLKALAQSAGVTDAVEFLGFVPYKELPALMARADIGMATSREDIFRQYASPLKLAEYMAGGLPVICSGGGEAELMITESGAGINIAFTPEACAEAVRQLFATPDELRTRREAAVAYAQPRTWQQLTAQLADFLTHHAQKDGSREH